MSALGLKRVLGLGSYQTPGPSCTSCVERWLRPGRDRLGGDVEADETYVGGPELGLRGRQTRKKAIVAIAVEVHQPKGSGAPGSAASPVSGQSLVSFVRDAVEPGSVVRSDGWRGYTGLPEAGYTRKKTVLSDSGDPAHVSMPAVHRVASLLKRWLLGTHQGSVGPEQLDHYLDEFTFRFNRRTSRSRGLLFYRLLEQAVVTDPATYALITRRNT